MTTHADYKVELEVFEGPLDLLLYLIRKDEVDIYNIPIERVTTQYMEYLNLMKMLDLNIAGEFLVMAATLMMIKSRMLLPVEERPEQMIEDDGEDPRWELVRQLVEYKKFKDVAASLENMEQVQENMFGPGNNAFDVDAEDAGVVLKDVSLFDLITALNDVLKRAKPEIIGEIIADTFTVEDKIETVLRLVRGIPQVPFTALFRDNATRNEIICTFLAVLELMRLRQIAVLQAGQFAEIVVTSIEPGA